MENPAKGYCKPVSGEKRARDILLYGAAFRDIPRLDEFGLNSETCSLAGHHVPQLSRDSTLTALAQLATFRLGARRAMVSLIDDQRQYILAEATPNMSVHTQSSGNTSNTLWLGSVSIPRTWGMCEKVLNIDLEALESNEPPTFVIRDLRQNVDHVSQTYVKEGSVEFYAGAPLFSPAGAIIGSLCILDDVPRPNGLSNEHQHSLQDIAQSVMEYLHTYTIKDQLWRGERFIRGLTSFSEGAEDLRPFKNARHPNSLQTHGTALEALASPFDERRNPISYQAPVTSSATTKQRSGNHQQQVMKKFQETMLPSDAKSMFSRAANVMMASSDLDGVIILDALIAANKSRQQRSHGQNGNSTGTASEDAGDSSYTATSSSEGDISNRGEAIESSSSKFSQVLGFATNHAVPVTSSLGSLLENDLSRMLHDYPDGKIITFGADGLALSSTDEPGESSCNLDSSSLTSAIRKDAGSRSMKNICAIQSMLTGARSVAFIPFWDFERSRWFAGCLCWSDRPHRLLSANVDLPYFKVFSHSIMRELSRLDALALNQSKTTFVASISHELRSPLHGILGTLEFIKDTPLDLFQTSMLNSLNACGNTLLDTINHVMDYAEIGEATKNVSSRRLKSAHTIRLSSKPLKNRRSQAGAFDLSIVTEEVVEAVFSGSTYIPVTRTMMDAPSSPSSAESEQAVKRKTCYITLDIAQEHDWSYCFPVGSWRRIVMNIFGNAIKYTHSGHIHVSLRTSEGSKATGTPTTVTLTVVDSGIGMSSKFLADKAFQPFSQEDSFASGTGLGLSIIRQIIETNGGKIEVSSEPSVGTRITVKLALTKPEASIAMPLRGDIQPPQSQFLGHLSRLQGRNICILHKHLEYPEQDPVLLQIAEGLARFTNVLANTLEKHLKMNVVRTTDWTGHESDIVVVPELSFDYLASIRRSRAGGNKVPVTIFVAMDALEAATLRSDWRVRSKESVVEIMTQPCGPFKLAYILNQCLDRFERPDENLKPGSSGNESTSASPIDCSERPSLSPRLKQMGPYDATMTQAKNDAANVYAAPTVGDAESSSHLKRPSIAAPQVLIVDDNPINRKLLIAFMKRHRYSYQEAENGLDALEAYKNSTSQFETILMDMSMPIMDGMTSTRAIRQYEEANKLPKCRIVALTGLASASARLEALGSGVDHFITKPMKFRELEVLFKGDNERWRRHSESQMAIHFAKEEKTFESAEIE